MCALTDARIICAGAVCASVHSNAYAYVCAGASVYMYAVATAYVYACAHASARV